MTLYVLRFEYMGCENKSSIDAGVRGADLLDICNRCQRELFELIRAKYMKNYAYCVILVDIIDFDMS